MSTEDKSIYKKAVSHSVLYGAANIFRKIIGLIMLPIYTQYLSPEDYAVVDLMMVTILLIEVFLAMRMGQAIFRFYYLSETEDEKKTIMSTAFLMAIFTGTVAYVVLAMNANSATQLMLGDNQYADLLSIFAVMLLLQSLEEYGFIYLRVRQKAGVYLILSLIKLFVQLFLNIYFIIYLNLSVVGVVYTAILSTALMALFAIVYTLYHAGIKFSKTTLKQFVLFSYPLWFASLGALYSQSSVKYFIRVFSSLEDVGLYALAARFGTLVLLFVWVPFSSVWDSLKYEIYEKKDSKHMYNNIFIMLVIFMSFVGLGVSLFSDIVIRIMATEPFWPAGKVVPILAILSISVGLIRFNNLGILLEKKTKIFAVVTYSNAFLITIGFMLFIPLLGMYGAALTVLMGSLFQLFWIERVSKKYYDMELEWSRAILISVTWLSCYSISLLLPDDLLLSILGRLLILLLFVILLFTTSILNKSEKEQIREFLNNGIKKARNVFA